MAKIAIVAHNVSVPLSKHRSKEFFDRIYFLARRYDEIHLISKEEKIKKGDRISVRDDLIANVIIHRVPNGLLASSTEIQKIFRSIDIDLVFADSIKHGASSILCKKKYGVPLVTFVQGYEAELKAIALKLRLGIEPNPGLLSNIFALHDLIVLRTSDKVLCVSPGLVDYARSLLPKRDWGKVGFIPHSLEYVKRIPKEAMMWAGELISSLKIDKDLLLMTIGIGPLKGTGIALKAHKYIVERYPNAVMILAGKTVDLKYVKMARELGLNENVLFLSLPRDRVLALLSHSSIFLSASFSEGFSWAVSEAMALGIPVIAYVNKSLEDAAAKKAIMGTKTLDPRDYAMALESLIRDENLRLEIVKNAKNYISPFVSFSENARLKMICDIINSLLEK
jgi:glycosyltransferase involved in cell wall biosynthesis